MQTRSIKLNSGHKKAIAIICCVAALAALAVFAKWSFGHAIAAGAAEPEVAAFGRRLAGRDAEARFENGLLLEKTQLPGDDAAVREFRAAVSLSPHHYVYWLALGRSLEQWGDDAAAEQAIRNAAELAPNYARVRWALGNLLLRQGRIDEAFAEIRKAAAADPSYASPAASAAWQTYGGDSRRIAEAVGDSPRISAALALLLAGEKRYSEAMGHWRSIEQGQITDSLAESGKALYGKLNEAGMYRSAIEVGSSVGLFSGVQADAITNGGFEDALATQDTHQFTWAISGGAFPRIGLNDAQRHSGSYSLLVSFGQGGKGARQIVQKAGVEAGGRYELRFHYRSELKPEGAGRIDVFAAGSSIAGSRLVSRAEWTEVQMPFTVPDGSEGIELRITMDACSAESCPVTGSIWFDDFALIKL